MAREASSPDAPVIPPIGRESAPTLCRHQVTIRLLARRLDISVKRGRFCRRYGVEDRHTTRDWIEALIGQGPGLLHAPICLE
jgi:hypothetical protein